MIVILVMMVLILAYKNAAIDVQLVIMVIVMKIVIHVLAQIEIYKLLNVLVLLSTMMMVLIQIANYATTIVFPVKMGLIIVYKIVVINVIVVIIIMLLMNVIHVLILRD